MYNYKYHDVEAQCNNAQDTGNKTEKGLSRGSDAYIPKVLSSCANVETEGKLLSTCRVVAVHAAA